MDADQSFYTEFTPVKSRRKRKNKLQKEPQSSLALLQYVRQELRQDEWVKECQRLYALQQHAIFSLIARLYTTCRNSKGMFECCFSRVPSCALPRTWQSIYVCKCSGTASIAS